MEYTQRKKIKECAMEFFYNCFQPHDGSIDPTIFDHTEPLVTAHQNDFLCSIPSPEEIFSTVKNLKGSSSPGPDGFPRIFYIHCWGFIGSLVIKAGKMLKSMQKFFFP